MTGAHGVWHYDISTDCIGYIMAGRNLKLYVFRRRIFIAEVSGAAVNIMSFINLGYGLNRTDRRVKIKIAHISVIICTDYYSDCF